MLNTCHRCPWVSGLCCLPDFLLYPSCKYMTACVASPKSRAHDLCTLFYVADNSKWRQRRQIILWKKKERDSERARQRVWERGDRRVQRLNLGPAISNTHSRNLCVCAHISHRRPAWRQKHFTWKLAHPLFTWVIVFHLQEEVTWLCVCFLLLFFLFSQFPLLACNMTHHLSVLLHLQAHICRARIKQNGRAIKWLWQLSSHTS